MTDRITVGIEAGVADVRMVRTDKMNALDDAMFSALIETGERLKIEQGIRAVVLSGEGRGFCAGLDTSNFASMASGGGSDRLRTLPSRPVRLRGWSSSTSTCTKSMGTSRLETRRARRCCRNRC